MLLSLVLVLGAVSCGESAVLRGEGPPPGYIGGNIPDRYRGLRSPFMLDDQLAFEAGRGLYQTNCAKCHGETGRGDGAKSPYLEPAPADFAAPPMLEAFRQHPDYVFWWVSDGVAQTSMPAYGDRLSEQERWQVITYAWSLAELPPSSQHPGSRRPYLQPNGRYYILLAVPGAASRRTRSRESVTPE